MNTSIQFSLNVNLPRKLFGWAFLIFGVAGLFSVTVKDVRMLVVGQKGTAIVQQQGDGIRKSSPRRILLSYEMKDGSKAEFEARVQAKARARPGTVFPIFYVPGSPGNARIDNVGQFWLPMIIGLSVSLFALLGAWFLLKK